MTTIPPDSPQGPVAFALAYETPPPPSDKSELLVRLAAIFNFITAGLEAFYLVTRLGMFLFVIWFAHSPVAGGGAVVVPGGPMPGGAMTLPGELMPETMPAEPAAPEAIPVGPETMPVAGPATAPGVPVGRIMSTASSAAFWFQIGYEMVIAVLALVVVSIKILGALWLIRRRRATWGMGLTAGIAGTVGFWSCPCCLLNIPTGIFTIIVMCMPQVRAYLSLPTDNPN